MTKFYELITFEHKNEHDLEHDLPKKKNFSDPKIYTANGDITKRWYVYFSYRNPDTQKLERMKNIYGKANSYKKKADRLTVLSSYRLNLLKLLHEGYSPFDNKAIDNTINKKQVRDNPIKKSEHFKPSAPIVTNVSKGRTEQSLKDAFDFALELKRNLVNARTLQDYGYKTNALLKWVSKQHPEITAINQLNKRVLVDFLNHILIDSSSRNRNNYRLALGTIFQTLEENEIININFIKNIPTLRSTPERNKTYSLDIENQIFKYLEQEDPILLLYIKFISYNFLRPIEVSRLTVGDINLRNNTISFKAKNSPSKTKIIPEILLQDLPDLTDLDKSLLLFTPNSIGGVWITGETNRRNYFSKRFKRIVKTHFNLSKDYGLYSFRHTYITKLYRMFLKETSPFEAKSKLMLITGHKSMLALEKYLRDIDAELPEDYSVFLK